MLLAGCFQEVTECQYFCEDIEVFVSLQNTMFDDSLKVSWYSNELNCLSKFLEYYCLSGFH